MRRATPLFVVLVLGLSSCSGGKQESESAQPETPAASASTAAGATTALNAYDPGSASDHLSMNVLDVFKGPVATGFEAQGGGVWSADDISTTFDVTVSDLYETGFVDAYGTAWLKQWGSPTGRDLISVTMQFVDTPITSRAMEVFRDALPSKGIQMLPNPKLGDGSFAFKGQVHGAPTVAYVWRSGDQMAIVASQGSSDAPTLSPQVMRKLARRVQGLIWFWHG